jgi:transcription antitermination factor NusG
MNIGVGDEVRVLSGPLEHLTGVVEEVDPITAKLNVKVKMFLGREMQVELTIDQVEKIDA